MYPYNFRTTALNVKMMSIAMDIKEDKILAVTFNPGQVKDDIRGSKALTPD